MYVYSLDRYTVHARMQYSAGVIDEFEMTVILRSSEALDDLCGSSQPNANKLFVSHHASVYFVHATYFTGKLFQKDVRDFLRNYFYRFS